MGTLGLSTNRKANKHTKKKKKVSFLKHQERMAFLFILAPMLLFFVFIVIPTVMAFILSLTNYDIIQIPKFIGLKNYKKLLQDEFFWLCLKNSAYYTLLYVPLGFAVSLATALLLNRRKFGVSIFRVCFYLPVLSSAIASATIWLWLLNPQAGIINILLERIGIQGPAWLNDTKYAMISIVIMSVWAGFGGNMMILLAGLQGIPKYLYESAVLDGANKWQEFRYVTLPGISATTFFVTTMLLIGAFQMFDQAYVLTQGGPGNATKTLVYYIYENGFGTLKMGYASALSVALFVIIFGVSVFNMRFNQAYKDFS